ncbi:MAG: hypothetical protein M1834_004233 [Cirrosporium novae-zelandiae]|nr:MAG: hypothetical protein M1834_004233 [Cirrosporium novae-zelandiae]
MTSCPHTSWLRISSGARAGLVNEARLARLVHSLNNPSSQFPRIVFFIGKGKKEIALKELFPENNIGRRQSQGIANLRLDYSTSNSNYPIFFADAVPFPQVRDVQNTFNCHERTIVPISWPGYCSHSIPDIIFARLFFLFTDVLCLFADDYGGFEAVAQHLKIWASIHSASDLPLPLRPKVIVITSNSYGSTTHLMLKENEFRHSLQQPDLSQSFSSIKLVSLPGKHLSSLARHRRLKEIILNDLDDARETRLQHQFLFSALHLEAFFGLAVQHTASTLHSCFDFILASRNQNSLDNNFQNHILDFVRVCAKHKLPDPAITLFIASSILMDAYPPGMHDFDPKLVFHRLYRTPCLVAFETFNQDTSFAESQCRAIEDHLIKLQPTIKECNSSSQVHLKNIRVNAEYWPLIKLNTTCLFCLRRKPEHVFQCGHSICDTCVEILGEDVLGLEHHYMLSACVLCQKGNSLTVRLKPPTAGVRILSIDGGGVRGIVPLEMLSALQNVLGSDCRIQDFFDLAVGTSSGGLIVLGLFIQQWNISQCLRMFKALATSYFGKMRKSNHSLFGHIRQLIRCWLSDGFYDAEALEQALKESFGVKHRMFDCTHGTISGTKVAVTATSISDASLCLFSNYNGIGLREKNCGYKHIRPISPENEPYIWEAGRATSAAPLAFPSAHVSGLGSFQNGGLKYNCPLDPALWESQHIWPATGNPDVVVSLGTGTGENMAQSPKITKFRHIFRDGFGPRLYRSFMSSLDGQSSWKSLRNRLDKHSKMDYFRLNVSFSGSEPCLDDIDKMEELQTRVHAQPGNSAQWQNTVFALLVSSLYFELSSMPQFDSGIYRCQGFIRCRINSSVFIQILTRLYPGEIEFTMGPLTIGALDKTVDICSFCHRYRKQVSFYARGLDDPINISIRIGQKVHRRLSGLPQTLGWFIKEQNLDSPFGSAQHKKSTGIWCQGCQTPCCEPRGKKRANPDESGRQAKRPRLA